MTCYSLPATCYLLLTTRYLLATHHPPLTTDCLPRCSRRCVWRRVPRSTCRRITPPGRPPWRYAARRRQWPRPSSPSSASSRRALKRAHSHSMPAILFILYICHTVIREETAAKCVCRLVARRSFIRIYRYFIVCNKSSSTHDKSIYIRHKGGRPYFTIEVGRRLYTEGLIHDPVWRPPVYI